MPKDGGMRIFQIPSNISEKSYHFPSTENHLPIPNRYLTIPTSIRVKVLIAEEHEGGCGWMKNEEYILSPSHNTAHTHPS